MSLISGKRLMAAFSAGHRLFASGRERFDRIVQAFARIALTPGA